MKTKRRTPIAAVTVGLAVLALIAALTAPGRAQNKRKSPNLADDPYVDQKNKFSIWPPAAWYMDTRNSRFAVKFSTTNYEAFITIDVVPVEGKIAVDSDFARFILEKNQQAQKQYPPLKFLGNRAVTLAGRKAFHTKASFPAGENTAIMNIYYVPGEGRLYQITTISPEQTSSTWAPLFRDCLETFTILD